MKSVHKIGDYLSDSSSVYQITGFSQVSDAKGKTREYLHFKSVDSATRAYTASIPSDNLLKAGLRPVLTKKEIDQLFTDLSTLNSTQVYNTALAREDLYQNDLKKTVSVLIYLWKNQSTLDASGRDLLANLLKHLSFEIGFVTDQKAPAVYSKLEKSLSVSVK